MKKYANSISIDDFKTMTEDEFIAYYIDELYAGSQFFQIRDENIEFSGNGYATSAPFILKFYTCFYPRDKWREALQEVFDSLNAYIAYGPDNIDFISNIINDSGDYVEVVK